MIPSMFKTATALGLAALIGGALTPISGKGQPGPAPALAPGVQPAKDWTQPQSPYVVANDTVLYSAPEYDPAKATAITLKRGERPQVLAEANQGLYLLIGRDGKGVGYAPRSLMCPANLCTGLKN